MESSIVIYMDNREARTKVADILRKRCEVREKQLTSADYLLSKNVVCERKTSGDFLQSLIDGRLFSQITAMKEAYESPLLLIEGDVWAEQRAIHPNAIRGALAAITVDFAVPIVWTKTQLESADMLFTIARREQEEKNSGIRLRNKRRFLSRNQQQEFLLSGLPKISDMLAKRLLMHFRTPEKVFMASEEQLSQVDGIGEVMARRIRKLLSRRYEKSILED